MMTSLRSNRDLRQATLERAPSDSRMYSVYLRHTERKLKSILLPKKSSRGVITRRLHNQILSLSRPHARLGQVAGRGTSSRNTGTTQAKASNCGASFHLLFRSLSSTTVLRI